MYMDGHVAHLPTETYSTFDPNLAGCTRFVISRNLPLETFSNFWQILLPAERVA